MEIEIPKPEKPANKVLALDSNIVIPMIFYDVGDFRIQGFENNDIKEISKNNTLVITPSVQEETKNHLYFQLETIRKKCEKLERFAFENIKKELESRFDEIMDKYAIKEKIPVKSEKLEEISRFYTQYIDVLERIVLEKISDKSISKKLRKLAQRESMLPEKGDMTLLAEVIELNSKSKEQCNQNFAILTNDKDLTVFSKELKNAFNLDIFDLK